MAITTTTTLQEPTKDVPSSFSIPTIDLAPYFSSSITSSGCKDLIAQIQDACVGVGFFQVVGHGVPRELQDAVFRGAEAFFKLSKEEKERVDMKKGAGRGYEVLAAQNLTSEAHSKSTVASLPDHKEGFYIGLPVPPSHPLVQDKSFLIGPNQFPTPSALSPSIFKDVMESYYQKMLDLSGTVLSLIEAGFPNEEGTDSTGTSKQSFEGIYYRDEKQMKEEASLGRGYAGGEDVIATLRLLHYPPLPSAAPPPADGKDGESRPQQLGAGPHTDFGFITLLMQDSIGGLQVLDPSCTSPSILPSSSSTSSNSSPPNVDRKEEAIWHSVTPNPDAYVVNIGDMLQMYSKGRYKSSVHRVVMEQGRGDRYSVPFFFDGRSGFMLRGGEGEDSLTVEGYMRERFRKTYGKL